MVRGTSAKRVFVGSIPSSDSQSIDDPIWIIERHVNLRIFDAYCPVWDYKFKPSLLVIAAARRPLLLFNSRYLVYNTERPQLRQVRSGI